MQITNLRLGVTKNLGNYESAKLEAEAIPTDGQTAEALLAELKEFVNKQLDEQPDHKTAKPDTKKQSKPKQIPAKGETKPPPGFTKFTTTDINVWLTHNTPDDKLAVRLLKSARKNRGDDPKLWANVCQQFAGVAREHKNRELIDLLCEEQHFLEGWMDTADD